jgi:hypothetical protein
MNVGRQDLLALLHANTQIVTVLSISGHFSKRAFCIANPAGKK